MWPYVKAEVRFQGANESMKNQEKGIGKDKKDKQGSSLEEGKVQE